MKALEHVGSKLSNKCSLFFSYRAVTLTFLTIWAINRVRGRANFSLDFLFVLQINVYNEIVCSLLTSALLFL